MQNTSHAAMAQRVEPKDSLDDLPTPPGAPRALLEHVVESGGFTVRLTCMAPACGALLWEDLWGFVADVSATE